MNTVSVPLKSDSDKLERFVNAVNNEVNKEINGILNEAEISKNEIIETAKDESLNEAFVRIQDNIKKVASKYVRIVAKAELDSKKEVLIEREKLSQKVFDNIIESLIDFRKKPQYLKYLISLAKTEKITSDATICLGSEDIKHSDEIQKALGILVKFKEDDSIKLGGLSILYDEQGLLIDKTIDLALSEQRDIFNEKNFFSQS